MFQKFVNLLNRTLTWAMNCIPEIPAFIERFTSVLVAAGIGLVRWLPG